jgi:hypothetical protein
MEREPLEGELLEDSHILMQPERYRIVELLAEKPMYIRELSRALPEERRLVAYHLAALEERWFFSLMSVGRLQGSGEGGNRVGAKRYIKYERCSYTLA